MNMITLSATDFPIKSVKIFNSGTLVSLAEVTRVFPLDFTQSLAQNESQVIEISNLPNLPNGEIRACVTTGSDDLLVTDYYNNQSEYTSVGRLFSHQPDDDDFSSDVLRDLKAECTRLEDERQLRQQSFAFLSTYMNSLAKGDAPFVAEPAQLVTFFDEFVEIGKSRSEVIAVLDKQIKDIQMEMDKEIRRLNLESLSLVTKATVVLTPVSGRTPTVAELELKYRVNATWKPEYEIHVTTIDGVPSSSVTLTYRCHIHQSSGENWDNVELAVTTAKSRVSSVGIPEPKKAEIRQQGFLSQPDYQPTVRPQVMPFWSTPGQGLFGSAQSAPHQHQADPNQGSAGAAQGPAAGNVFGAFQGLFGAPSAQPSAGPMFGAIQGQPTTTTRGLFGSTSAQSSTGPIFGAFQGQPTTTTQGLFGSTPAQPSAGPMFGALQGQPTTTAQGLFGSTLAQPSTGPIFVASQFSAQPQASSSTAIPPYSSTQNSSVSSFGSTTTEDILSFNQQAPNLQQAHILPVPSAPAPSPPQHQDGERAVLAQLEKDVTHTTTAKVSIPSRAKGGPHHILIATIPLKATFTRVAVPSVDTRVFFTCDIFNTSNYVLTPGTVHTYLDGKHVSDSNITSVKQPQTIHCSLGIDPAVTTQFSRTVDSLPDFTAVLNGKVTTTHAITTTIKNTHRNPVSNVIVRASLPLPADPRVTVALQEPEGLSDFDSGTVRVTDGCHARWSTTGNRTGKNDGLFEWVCSSVKPGSQVLKAVWHVTAPRGLNFTTQ